MKGLFALLAATILALFMVACGGNGEGPELGDFPAITKGLEDEPFTLTAPSSRSPGQFTFTSSRPEVASIDGTTVTIHAVGTTTITASQPSVGSYGPTQKSTTLTVKPGTTTTTKTCVSPAELKEEKLCVVPGTVATIKPANSALTWTNPTRQDTWVNAEAYCKGSTINNLLDWRLPSVAELNTLYTSNAAKDNNWTRAVTWSSVPTAAATGHTTVNLSDGTAKDQIDTATAYVTCVR
jgi:hypothetical protein